MNRLIAALVASALAFGPAWALADDSDAKPPEDEAAPKSQPAKDWPTRWEQQEATAAAARERAEGAPKERPLVGDFGPPDARAVDQTKVRPKQPKELPMIEPPKP